MRVLAGKHVHNATSKFQICSVLVESSFETPQEPLVISTHQLHLDQELNLSSPEKEQMAIYQAIKGISDGDGRHVIILTTLPNIDWWAVSLVECVNRARECIRTEVEEGRITLKIRYEDKVEVTSKGIFEEFTCRECWDLREDEVKDKVNGGDKIEERDKIWEYLEPDCPEKKEATMSKSRHTPPKHTKINDEERQLSDQYCSFPHRPRFCLIPILEMQLLNLFRLLLILLILLIPAYLICHDEF